MLAMTLAAIAQDSNPPQLPLIPDDAPPWLIALGTVASLALLTSPIWGPLVTRMVKPKPDPPPAAPSPPDGTGPSPGPSPNDPTEKRYDAQMALIEKMVEGIERDQERDREEAARLREENGELLSRIVQLESEVRHRDQTIAQLHRTIDRLLEQPRQGPTPWPGQGPGPTHSV